MQNNLSERLENLAVEIIKVASRTHRTFIERHLIGQLIRSSTSVGANYEEACGAESRSDFIHKLQLVLKELRESLYWLRLLLKCELISSSKIDVMIKEATELANIIGKSILTAKKKK